MRGRKKEKRNIPAAPNVFSPADTRFIKGFAILLLLWHHLTIAPDNYYSGATFPAKFIIDGKSLTQWFAGIGNISVTIFSFLGGYALYKCYTKPHFFTSKILSLYKNFWKIFFIFVPVGFLFFSHQEPYCAAEYVCHNFENFDPSGFIYNLVGLSTSYNSEWWFFMLYPKALFLGLMFIYMNRKRQSPYLEIGELLILKMIFSALLTLSSKEGFDFISGNTIFNDYFAKTEVVTGVVMGSIFAKYELLPGLIRKAHSLPFGARKVLPVIVFLFILVVRKTTSMDYIMVPLLIVALYELFGYLKPVRKIMEFVGKHSGNMYYMHTFLIFYFGATSALIYKPDNSLVSFLIFVAMCLAISVAIEYFYGFLYKLIAKTGLIKPGVLEPVPVMNVQKPAPVVHVQNPGSDGNVGKSVPETLSTGNTVTGDPNLQSGETFRDTLLVDSYSDPVPCVKCGMMLTMGKMFCRCPECGIFYVKNKYSEDQGVREIVSGTSTVILKKR